MPLRLAIAGLGLAGQRHAEAIRLAAGVELAAIVDHDTAKPAVAESGIACYASLESLFAGEEVDGVVVATPNALHTAQAQACVARRVPVLVEKPIATTVADAVVLVRDARASGVPLLVGHHRRHNPLIQKVKEVIGAGRIGELRAIHGTCWLYKPDAYFDAAPWRKHAGAGPIAINLVHDIDLIRYLCGEITQVFALATPSLRGYANEDVASAVLRFANGAVGTITVSDSIAAPWSWEMTAKENPVYPSTGQSCCLIGGSKASLSIPDLKLWSHGEGEPDWWGEIASTTLAAASTDPLVTQIEHFGAVIRADASPLVSGAEGLRNLQVIEAIAQSAKTGQPVAIEPLADDG